MKNRKVQAEIDVLKAQIHKLELELNSAKIKTLITFVVDESGSMVPKKNEVISGFNDYLVSQKRNSSDDASITLIKFNGLVTSVYERKPLLEAPELTALTYNPNGWTALYDAIQ